MNETLQTILNRRSIRAFKPDPVPQADLDAIVQAGLYAPSGMNRQGVHIVVIRDQALLAHMNALCAAEVLRIGYRLPRVQADDPNYSVFWHAPVVILLADDKAATWAHFDCGAAAENICLAATSLGIGSLVIGSSRLLFQSAEVNALREKLALPEGYEHVCLVALGYTDGEQPKTPPRKPGRVNYLD